MVDILVRNVDSDTARRLKEKAAAAGVSLSETVRNAIVEYVKPDKTEAWTRLDVIRREIGKVSGDVVADIREDRDSR